MGSTLKLVIRLFVLIASLLLFYFLVLFVSSVVQLAEAADRLYLGSGQVVFILLMTVLVTLVMSPPYIYFKFPKALVPPNEDSGPEHEKYMLQLRRKLVSNPLVLSHQPPLLLNSDDDVIVALELLSKEADKVIREAAAAVFLGTALCQNGKLDGLITMSTQVRMVWRVACVYQQRPSPRQLLYLYSNVATGVLLAESIDDYDFVEILAPIITSATIASAPAATSNLASTAISGAGLLAESAGILGASAVASGTSKILDGATKVAEGALKLITNSVIDGIANAFLTLRVGCIANQYCASISKPNKSIVRRNATYAAASMVTDIAKDNGAQIFSAAKKVAKEKSKSIPRKVSDSVGYAYGGVKNVSVKSTDAVINVAKSIGNSVGSVFKKS